MKRPVGVRRAADLGEEEGSELSKCTAAARRHGSSRSGENRPEIPAGCRWLTKPERGQAARRAVGVVNPLEERENLGIHPALSFVASREKELLELSVHPAPVGVESLPEAASLIARAFALSGKEPEPAGQPAHPLLVSRERLRLPLVNDLDLVLDVPEKAIRFAERLRNLLGQQIDLSEARQRRECGPHPQTLVATGVHELKRLRYKLHLANSARPQLDIELEASSRVLAVHPLLHLLDLFERLEVEVPTKDKRHQFVEKGFAEREIPGRRPCLQHRPPLPGLTPRFVVEQRGREGIDHRSVLPMGPKAEIDPEDEAILGLVLEHAGRALGKPRRPCVGVEAAPRTALGGHIGSIIEVDEIDVGAEVELGRPELAHCEHDEAGFSSLRECPVFFTQPESAAPERNLDRRVGEGRELSNGVLDRGEPEEVARANPKKVTALQGAEDGSRAVGRACRPQQSLEPRRARHREPRATSWLRACGE